MHFSSIFSLLALTQLISASAITFILGAKDKQCYYVFTEKPMTQIGYYFAVQDGGSFDVDYAIKNPRGDIIVNEEKQRQGDFVFSAEYPGEYEFCFSNGMSTFADKIIDFEIKFEKDDTANGAKASMPQQPNTKPLAHVESMQATVDKIDHQLDGLLRTLQYYKTRNNRNQATVKSTESRIYYFSIFEVLLMVGMAFLQITIVQFFFKGSRKQLV
ncbi:emp24/gp25L/p24 family/GOLD-domain-containing protein [Scheffersomyces xylosifermentans]|uniref:emp24/gp25L/p24 family/GOLD-domain-containing protein n=1 Tax=Scheffersomyces xylosifermentans TaxID=1304137 RepID=UPI00315CCBD0